MVVGVHPYVHACTVHENVHASLFLHMPLIGAKKKNSPKKLKIGTIVKTKIIRHPVKTVFQKNVRFKSYGQKTAQKRLKLAKNLILASVFRVMASFGRPVLLEIGSTWVILRDYEKKIHKLE